MKHTHRLAVPLLLLMLLWSSLCTAGAQGITVDQTAEFCFSADDFTSNADDDGIFVVSVPNSTVAAVYYGTRIVKAGDALPKDALNQLTLKTDCVTEQQSALDYYTISDGKVSGLRSIALSILPKKNEAPTAQKGSLQTYKNIANQGQLHATDPEDDVLTYQLLDAPKRGTVEIQDDGAYFYTPSHNKVGKDSFTFTVTDIAGNTSTPAKISIEILKPSDKAVYQDMTQDPDAFEAMWLKEQGLFSGSSICGNLCFSPDRTVERGEFLIMVMKLVDAEADSSILSSGFADEERTPGWMQPYIVSAWSNGMISGISTDEGLEFQPSADLTAAEAAVMLQNILQVPLAETKAVFSNQDESAVPAWASEATAALMQAGIQIEVSDQADLLTRREAANILYGVHQLLTNETLSDFYWVS